MIIAYKNTFLLSGNFRFFWGIQITPLCHRSTIHVKHLMHKFIPCYFKGVSNTFCANHTLQRIFIPPFQTITPSLISSLLRNLWYHTLFPNQSLKSATVFWAYHFLNVCAWTTWLHLKSSHDEGWRSKIFDIWFLWGGIFVSLEKIFVTKFL